MDKPLSVEQVSPSLPGVAAQTGPVKDRDAAADCSKDVSKTENSNAKGALRKSTTAEWLREADSAKNDYLRFHFADAEARKIVTRDPTSWLGTIFLVRGRAPLGGAFWFVQSCTVLFVVGCKFFDIEYEYAPDGHKLIGTAVTFLVVLRTVNGLRKYWESVGAWTRLAAACTDCAQQLATYLQNHQVKIQSLKYVITFCVAVRSHLRKEKVTAAEVSGILQEHEIERMNAERSPPLYCLLLIRRCLAQAVEQKQVLPLHMAIEKSLYNMMSVFADCEKLLHPMPIALVSHLRTFILLYLITLVPIIYPQFGWTTIVVSALGAYALIGLENASVQMENPFGYDANDLPIDRQCAEIMQEIVDLIKENYEMDHPDEAEKARAEEKEREELEMLNQKVQEMPKKKSPQLKSKMPKMEKENDDGECDDD